MTYKRLARGSFKQMTPEQQRAHILMLGARYRKNNRKKLQERNRYYHKLYMETKPYLCVCKVCGKEFNAPSPNYRRCEECRAIPSAAELHRAKMREKNAINAKILELARTGVKQMEISRITGICQPAISQLCIRNGIRRWPQRTRRKQAA